MTAGLADSPVQSPNAVVGDRKSVVHEVTDRHGSKIKTCRCDLTGRTRNVEIGGHRSAITGNIPHRDRKRAVPIRRAVRYGRVVEGGRACNVVVEIIPVAAAGSQLEAVPAVRLFDRDTVPFFTVRSGRGRLAIAVVLTEICAAGDAFRLVGSPESTSQNILVYMVDEETVGVGRHPYETLVESGLLPVLDEPVLLTAARRVGQLVECVYVGRLRWGYGSSEQGAAHLDGRDESEIRLTPGARMGRRIAGTLARIRKPVPAAAGHQAEPSRARRLVAVVVLVGQAEDVPELVRVDADGRQVRARRPSPLAGGVAAALGFHGIVGDLHAVDKQVGRGGSPAVVGVDAPRVRPDQGRSPVPLRTGTGVNDKEVLDLAARGILGEVHKRIGGKHCVHHQPLHVAGICSESVVMRAVGLAIISVVVRRGHPADCAGHMQGYNVDIPVGNLVVEVLQGPVGRCVEAASDIGLPEEHAVEYRFRVPGGRPARRIVRELHQQDDRPNLLALEISCRPGNVDPPVAPCDEPRFSHGRLDFPVASYSLLDHIRIQRHQVGGLVGVSGIRNWRNRSENHKTEKYAQTDP